MKIIQVSENLYNKLKILPFILGIILFYITGLILWAILGFVISLTLIFPQNKWLFLPLILGIVGFFITRQLILLPLGLGIIFLVPIVRIMYRAWIFPITFPPYYFLSLQLQFGNPKLETALQWANKAVAATPENFMVYYQRAIIYCRQHKFAEMEADAQKFIQLKPGMSLAYSLLGHSLYFQGHYLEAKDALEKALDLTTEKAIHHCTLGQVYYRLQDYSQAIHHFNLATMSKMKSECQLTLHYFLLAV